MQVSELDGRNYQDLEDAFQLSLSLVEKKYLREIARHPVVPIPKHIQELSLRHNIRLFKLNKLVYDKGENNLDKLASVYHAIRNVDGSLIMIIDSDGTKTDLYLGTCTRSREETVGAAKEALEKSFLGNFPGSQLENLTNSRIESVMQGLFQSELTNNDKVISAVSGIPSFKGEDKMKFVQGLEKLIDAMKDEAFSAILIADPVSHGQMEEIRRGYESLYSQLVPFAGCELGFGLSDSIASTEGWTQGITETVTESLSKTQSYTRGATNTKTEGRGSSLSFSPNAGLTAVGAGAGFLFGGPIGAALGGAVLGGVSAAVPSYSRNRSTSTSETTSESTTDGSTNTKGRSESTSSQESRSETVTEGRSKNLTVTFENKTVTNLLAKIEDQLTRLRGAEDFGMWNCAAYFISSNSQTSRVAASTYKALMRGENSAVEQAFINTWDNSHRENLQEVRKYLQKLHHPLIDLQVPVPLDLPYVTPGSLVSGKELTISFGLPQKSISGLPVIETAEFGRNVITYDGFRTSPTFRLGHIFHRGKKESTSVDIDINSLTMHTFITGSTGTGKSNCIYQILNELHRKNIPFLVIEPAKGEYKNVFGWRKGVSVFGTNPAYSPLLQINPFRFPKRIHVLEHIDRLVEIFNACWPMYAAMPAILKEAIELAYEKAGWDLENSFCLRESQPFPTFDHLLEALPLVINHSGYSEEVKSNYIGALVTRVRSLTNGLAGRMFAGVEVGDEVLFDQSCIIDLSRIGSMETKALLMGILFMRLQEYRMSAKNGMNNELQHVTVLEEAHHLLRKSNTDQSAEHANLHGKSVEMIATAIAEMRTYGEGFIIADQAPNLLDSSVIRNTNTKIVLRLPDERDRIEVGKAANLNTDQMQELAKLKTGVAAVYQNNWLQPILCAMEPFVTEQGRVYTYEGNNQMEQNKVLLQQWLSLLLKGRVGESQSVKNERIDPEPLKKWLLTSRTEPAVRERLLAELDRLTKGQSLELWKQENFSDLAQVISKIVPAHRILQSARDAHNFNEWDRQYRLALRHYVNYENAPEYELALIQCLLRHQAAERKESENFYFSWVEHVKGGSSYV
ncbi:MULTISPECIES: ATP-binding protein [Brevibacillus]|uniref:ATP-binding protein n=1 Tax=Brevibacillus TaxID=55080 RepID=UPI003158B1AD